MDEAAPTFDELACGPDGTVRYRPGVGALVAAAFGAGADRCLYWWAHPGKVFNFGDWVGPFLYERLTGRRPLRYRPKFSPLGRTMFTAGSILRWIRRPRSAIIWGSGVMSAEDRFPAPLQVLAVRGPRTRARMMELGYDCPAIYGDPAILLPRVFSPGRCQRHALGLIPHYHDLDHARRLAAASDEILLIDVRRPVRAVIRDILSCAAVASSSLHGIIVAQGYGVPALRVTFGARIGGDGTKFADHALAVGLPVAEAEPVGADADLAALAARARAQPVPDLAPLADALMRVCPFPLADQGLNLG